MTEIKFTVDADQLNKALKMASIVSPQVLAEQERGYLFVVGGDRCHIYSKNGGHEARSSFPIFDVEGSGSFMYPSDYIGTFNFISGPIAFVATEEGKSFKIKHTHGPTGVIDRPSFDPRSMNSFEKDIQAAIASQQPKLFNIKILQLALGMAKSFAAKEKEPVSHEFYKTVQVFGDEKDPELAKKAAGYLFASNGVEACYFHSDAFVGKGLTAPWQHLPLLEAFLTQSSGSLRVYKTDKCTYVINESNDVVGWPHHSETYQKFSYYSKNDQIVVNVNWKTMSYQLQYMREGLHKDKKKIRLHFDPSKKEFWFSSMDEGTTINSLAVPILSALDVKIENELVTNVNVEHMLHIFAGAEGEWIEFRIMILPPGGQRLKELVMFRTIDNFLVTTEGLIRGAEEGKEGIQNVPEGMHVCRVTRFAPGLD